MVYRNPLMKNNNQIHNTRKKGEWNFLSASDALLAWLAEKYIGSQARSLSKEKYLGSWMFSLKAESYAIIIIIFLLLHYIRPEHRRRSSFFLKNITLSSSSRFFEFRSNSCMTKTSSLLFKKILGFILSSSFGGYLSLFFFFLH